MSEKPDTETTWAVGNTSATARKRNYMFTWNNYSQDDIQELLLDFEHSSQYCFQEETGASGTPHLQGVVLFKHARGFDALKRKYPKVHWEVLRSKKHGIQYCSKELTRSGKRYTNIELREEIVDYFVSEGCKYTSWQEEIIQILESPVDRRKIYWYYDYCGACGKSTFARHLRIKFGPKILILTSGKASDLAKILADVLEKVDIKAIIFDIPRDREAKFNYGFMEEVKNGYLISGKYESCSLLFNAPHVIVMSNWMPDESKMSRDRWVINQIGDVGLCSADSLILPCHETFHEE